MQHTQLIQGIRRLILKTFREMGASHDLELSENILLRDNYYCGRRFFAGDFQAIWFVEEGEIKFYTKDGGLVRTAKTSEAWRDQASGRHAA